MFSPGPCTPQQAAGAIEIVREFREYRADAGDLPGASNHRRGVWGEHRSGDGADARARQRDRTQRRREFSRDFPIRFMAGRYHSLVVERESLPPEIEVTAWTADGEVMAIAHRELPIVGLQFHPESILTEAGYDLLAGFLRLAGLGVPGVIPSFASEMPTRSAPC